LGLKLKLLFKESVGIVADISASDTTILSSMASGCDHIAHVRTQMPYAIGIGVLGMLLRDIPTAYGLSPWISIVIGSAVIFVCVWWLGKKSGSKG
jgi:Na+/H+ antiporter NhaC